MNVFGHSWFVILGYLFLIKPGVVSGIPALAMLDIVFDVCRIALIALTVLDPMAVSMIVSQAIAHILNMFAAKRILNYPMRNQLRDLLPATAFSLFMVLGIEFVSYKIQSAIWNLIVSIALGIAIYMTLCLVFRVKEFYMIFTLLKSKLKKADKA